MAKLRLLVENYFDATSNKLTNNTKFISSLEQKDGSFVYNNIKLKVFEASKAVPPLMGSLMI